MDTAQYTSLYLQEMRDNLATLGQILIELEKQPGNRAFLAEVMRLWHSCKGMSSTMGFEKTAAFCHSLEDLFDSAQKGESALDPAVIDRALRALDEIGRSLRRVEREGKEADVFAVIGAAPSGDDGDRREQDPVDQGRLPHIRVDSRKLDQLMDLAGELRTLKMQFAALALDEKTALAAQPLLDRFGRLTDELQFSVSESRLVPLDQLFARFPRLVRDLAKEQGKNVRFEMIGTAIELDKSLVDQLMAPLIHLLRNAVDHGIELPEVRKTAGKNEEGSVTLQVERDRGYAVLRVSDDGEVITIRSLQAAAKARGLPARDIDAIGGDAILDTITRPGFSTKTAVSMISGRGVGLSAVKSAVKAMGGTLQFTQEDGRKCFMLSLPLQLSVIRALLADIGGRLYAIPFVHTERILTIDRSAIRTTLGQESMVVDDEDVPLLRLAEIFDRSGEKDEKDSKDAGEIILVRSGSGMVGCIVDRVVQNLEVMVKPAADVVKHAKFFSGSTILADGRVALVVDVPGLLEHVRLHKA